MRNFLPPQNKYPKKIYVRDEVYKVVFCKRLKDFGETDPVKRIIRIKHGMSRREIFSTFLHEVLHAIEFEHDLIIRHSLVYQLEKGIFEVLVDNFL